MAAPNDVLNEYQVKILNLPVGQYRYTFPVTDAFFAAFDNALVQKGNLKAKVSLDKSETLIRARFAIDGTMELESDRSLELFDHPVSIQEELIYKFGEDNREISEEMQQIAWDTLVLDLSQPIYEFLMLSVPMRKLKPEEENEEPVDGIGDDERRLVYRSADESPEADQAPEPDPQWEALRKLFPN